MKVLVTYRSMSTSKGLVKNGEIVDLPADEIAKIRVMKPHALQDLPELELPKETKKQKAPAKKAPAKRKRARKADGTLRGDDPSTPDVNEAWENG